jgi:tRNA A37 methylthiotransferase MiaB
MRRPYTAAAYRALCDQLRAARPDVAITTDLIVGFPGETDADFRDTLALVRGVGFVDAYSFKYSPRPGTPAAGFADAVAPEVAQARLEELQDLLRGLTLAAHRRRVGSETEVLVEGASRKFRAASASFAQRAAGERSPSGGRAKAIEPGAGQASGRDPYHRVVNLAVGAESGLRPGDFVRVCLVEATPRSLIGEPIGAGRPIVQAAAGRAQRAEGERSQSA